MIDYLLDAMNEISDEHICEAVNFKTQSKKLSLRKIIPIAACIVFVVVAFVAGAEIFETQLPTTEPTIIGTPTCAPTPGALIQNTTGSHGVPPAPDWEELTYGERFLDVTVNGIKYVYSFDRLSDEKIGELIATETIKREYLFNDWHSATVEAFKIKGITSETYIAVKFSEDESGEYLLYVCPDFEPDTLGFCLDAINIDNINFIGETANYHNYFQNGDFYEAGYKIDPKGHKELSGLLWKNRDAIRCDDDFHRDKPINSDETITTQFAFIGEQKLRIYISKADDKTHLCFAYSAVTGKQFCFELADNAFDYYLEYLENEAEVIYSRHGCPTTFVTTPTTEGTTLPYQPVE